MKFVEIKDISEIASNNLDLIIYVMETRVFNKMSRGENPKFDRNDFHAMSCVMKIKQSDLRKIFKACWTIWTEQKAEDRL